MGHQIDPTGRWRTTCMIVGGSMLVVCLAVAWLLPEPSQLQERLVLLIMALGGAFLAAGLAGMIELEGTIANTTVRGTGSLAIFLLIYFGDVSTRVSEQNQPEEKAALIDKVKRTHLGADGARSLDAIAQAHGYKDFRRMSVSATKDQLEAVFSKVGRR
jgi:hypothetical protein